MADISLEEQEKYRPPSLDKTGHRNFIYMADFVGRFKNLKNIVHPFLIVFFLVIPWISIGGKQLVLIDIPNRRFNLFGLSFWAHDGPLIIFLLAGAALTLAFVTAIWGRVWCGWACPQTVFLDSVYRRIERFVEGKARERRKLDSGPWTFEKVRKKFIKWSLYIIVSLIITHSFLAYFVEARNLPEMVTSPPWENPSAFVFIALSNFLVLFNFAWFREQFCLIVCPYGRFQAVLMDQHSLAVSYDTKRGEPRRAKDVPKEQQGDCVNCGRCIEVCPTSIDIRRGIQMECLACTNCIDACDAIMERFNKPKGLIRYTTLTELDDGKKPKNLRPRTVVYAVFITIFAIGLISALAIRKPLRINLIRAIETPYQVVKGPDDKDMVINHYRMKLHNQSDQDIFFRILPSSFDADKGTQIIMAKPEVISPAGESENVDVFVKAPRDIFQLGTAKIKLDFKVIKGAEGLELNAKEIPIVGPIE